MTIDDVLKLLPVVLTLSGGALLSFQRLASLRSRRFDRVAQLSTSISGLTPNDVKIRTMFELERKKVIDTLQRDAHKTTEGKFAIAAMVVGTLLVVLAAATTSSGLAEQAPWFLGIGALLAIPGVIAGFILSSR